MSLIVTQSGHQHTLVRWSNAQGPSVLVAQNISRRGLLSGLAGTCWEDTCASNGFRDDVFVSREPQLWQIVDLRVAGDPSLGM